MKQKGFTLIELLVSFTFFILVIILLVGLFVQLFKAQSKVITSQQLLDQTSYALEYMGRFLRMAQKSINTNCLSVAGITYENGTAGNEEVIRFINYQGNCQEFFLDSGQIKRRRSGATDGSRDGSFNTSTPSPITSNSFLIKAGKLKFRISGAQSEDSLQPKVTISIEIGSPPDLKPKIQLQTTVSQRNLDLP